MVSLVICNPAKQKLLVVRYKVYSAHVAFGVPLTRGEADCAVQNNISGSILAHPLPLELFAKQGSEKAGEVRGLIDALGFVLGDIECHQLKMAVVVV